VDIRLFHLSDGGVCNIRQQSIANYIVKIGDHDRWAFCGLDRFQCFDCDQSSVKFVDGCNSFRGTLEGIWSDIFCEDLRDDVRINCLASRNGDSLSGTGRKNANLACCANNWWITSEHGYSHLYAGHGRCQLD